ncbi:transglutaminase family protein [archaeon]
MVKTITTGKKRIPIAIPKADIKTIKRRVTAADYTKHVGATESFYMRNMDGKVVEKYLPLNSKIKNSHEAVLTLVDWVHKNIGWRDRPAGEKWCEDGLDVLDEMGGNCNDKAGLLISFAKAIKIPSRFEGLGHGKALLMLPHDDVEIEFFPSNYMVMTREGQWEIGKDDSGRSYIRFRDLDLHSAYQFHEHDDVFKKKFKNPLNRALQKMYKSVYDKAFQKWDAKRSL